MDAIEKPAPYDPILDSMRESVESSELGGFIVRRVVFKTEYLRNGRWVDCFADSFDTRAAAEAALAKVSGSQ